MTHKDRVLNHLQKFGSITTFEAFNEYGITRLSAVIYNLKKDGHIITTESISRKNRYGRSIVFKKYMLKGEDKWNSES